jgi:hypothetical protein
MDLEALQGIHSEVKALGAEIVVLTPELERYTRNLYKKLNLTFNILTDLHLKTAEQFRIVYVLPDYLRELYKSFGNALDRVPRRIGIPIALACAVCNRQRRDHSCSRCECGLHDPTRAFRKTSRL